jgi:hypothetical protein
VHANNDTNKEKDFTTVSSLAIMDEEHFSEAKKSLQSLCGP